MSETTEKSTLFGVEVPSKPTVAFLFAALQAAEQEVRSLSAGQSTHAAQLKALVPNPGAESPQVLQVLSVSDLTDAVQQSSVADLPGGPSGRYKFLCQACSKEKGRKWYHQDHRTVNEHQREAKAKKRAGSYTPERIDSIHEVALKEYAAREAQSTAPVEQESQESEG
jgi:hypothetical protein